MLDVFQLARFRKFMKRLSTGLSADLNFACFCRNNLKPELYYRKIRKRKPSKSINTITKPLNSGGSCSVNYTSVIEYIQSSSRSLKTFSPVFSNNVLEKLTLNGPYYLTKLLSSTVDTIIMDLSY